MATRSFIGKLNKDGSVAGAYCHWDGYPENNGNILKLYYKDIGKVDALLACGSISSLRQEIGEQHDFDDQTFAVSLGWTTFYHRDRGEDFEENVMYSTVRDMLRDVASDLGAEYAYVFDSGEWQVYTL
jgi:hypothetical protein